MQTLAQTLEHGWNLHGVAVGDALQTFDNRQVRRFDAAEGSFVCKTIGGAAADDAFARQTAIYGWLEARGFRHAPRLLRTRDGENFLRQGDAAVLVMERVSGAKPEGTPDCFRRLGMALATLNGFTDYPEPAPITVDAIRPHFAGIAEGLPAAIRKPYLAAAGSLPDIDALPKSLIHFEASLKNAVRKPDGGLVLVDWDEAGIGATVLDPGFHLISQFVSESRAFDAASARAFYGAYLAARPLTDAEKGMLFDASLFHALRYVVWGDPERRWARIRWAMEHRAFLEHAAFGTS
ncbi:MAG TPA: phosphotransferase [Patescibacteria group bacterium]|nr:phosphotransferase [Patescibacteria group bacterium]